MYSIIGKFCSQICRKDTIFADNGKFLANNMCFFAVIGK